jgi:hypothetical protein
LHAWRSYGQSCTTCANGKGKVVAGHATEAYGEWRYTVTPLIHNLGVR